MSPQRIVDLRSDTVTHPTPKMRQAMVEAELGDDLLGDDPTAKHLEAMAAARMGKEAATFVPTGTMANLIALLTHCGRGDEAIVGSQSHIYQTELDGAAAMGSIQLRPARNGEDGRIDPDEVRSLVRHGENFPRTALVCLENTHNFEYGAALSASYTKEIADIAHGEGAALHVDGARIFNAAIAQETTPAELLKDADTMMFCVSKGLACPIGSILCGPEDFIRRARRNRRMVGGGMRQVGVLAAAGIVALEEMVDRLADDHANARALADGLATIAGIKSDPAKVQTNILFAVPEGIDGAALITKLRERGVLVSGTPQRLRLVTHYGIERDDIDWALENIREVAASLV